MKLLLLSLLTIPICAMQPVAKQESIIVNVTVNPEHRHHHRHIQKAKAPKDDEDPTCGQCCGVGLSLLKSLAKLVK